MSLNYLDELKQWIIASAGAVSQEIRRHILSEISCRLDICFIAEGLHVDVYWQNLSFECFDFSGRKLLSNYSLLELRNVRGRATLGLAVYL
jgi:hypothetical protein